jgi:predicted PurR-regulated permease PerM
VLFTGNEETPKTISRILPGWFLLCSVVAGVLCLLLTPLAWYVRRTKPPRSIMVTAIVIGVLPLIVVTVMQIMHRT